MARRVLSVIVTAAALVPALALAVPRPPAPRLLPGAVSPLPTYVRLVEPSLVGLSVNRRETPVAVSTTHAFHGERADEKP